MPAEPGLYRDTNDKSWGYRLNADGTVTIEAAPDAHKNAVGKTLSEGKAYDAIMADIEKNQPAADSDSDVTKAISFAEPVNFTSPGEKPAKRPMSRDQQIADASAKTLGRMVPKSVQLKESGESAARSGDLQAALKDLSGSTAAKYMEVTAKPAAKSSSELKASGEAAAARGDLQSAMRDLSGSTQKRYEEVEASRAASAKQKLGRQDLNEQAKALIDQGKFREAVALINDNQ